jgi:hypothetical protein
MKHASRQRSRPSAEGPRRRRYVASAALCAVASAACSETGTTLAYTPYTGVNIDSTALVAPFGCGTGAGQVYRYLAVINYEPLADAGADAAVPSAPGLPAAAVVDCFANGVFENLPFPSSSLSSYEFAIAIYAYDFASLPQELTCGTAPCVLDAGAAQVAGMSANWTTSCVATEEMGASLFAVCGALAPSEANMPQVLDASAADTLAESGPRD